MRADRTHKLYQRVQVVHQGKSYSDGDEYKERAFAPEVVARFVLVRRRTCSKCKAPRAKSQQLINECFGLVPGPCLLQL